MVKVLDTVVKVELYESIEEQLCVSFGFTVQHTNYCVPQKYGFSTSFQTSRFKFKGLFK